MSKKIVNIISGIIFTLHASYAKDTPFADPNLDPLVKSHGPLCSIFDREYKGTLRAVPGIGIGLTGSVRLKATRISALGSDNDVQWLELADDKSYFIAKSPVRKMIAPKGFEEPFFFTMKAADTGKKVDIQVKTFIRVPFGKPYRSITSESCSYKCWSTAWGLAGADCPGERRVVSVYQNFKDVIQVTFLDPDTGKRLGYFEGSGSFERFSDEEKSDLCRPLSPSSPTLQYSGE